jgi:hypothetical protein
MKGLAIPSGTVGEVRSRTTTVTTPNNAPAIKMIAQSPGSEDK